MNKKYRLILESTEPLSYHPTIASTNLKYFSNDAVDERATFKVIAVEQVYNQLDAFQEIEYHLSEDALSPVDFRELVGKIVQKVTV